MKSIGEVGGILAGFAASLEFSLWFALPFCIAGAAIGIILQQTTILFIKWKIGKERRYMKV